MRKSIVLLALLCGTALAVEPPLPPPPAMAPVPDAAPDAAPADESVEPQVTIIQREEAMVEEYRIHNQLFMIKVTRNNAKPYYLVDSDGDGKLDKRRNEMNSKIPIPPWIASR